MTHTWLSSQPPVGVDVTLNRASPQAWGLMLWYPTVEYVGRLADYASANRFGGTLTGPPGARREPSVGAGMDFTGSERWEVTHVSDLSTTTRTISAWVIGDTLAGTQTIIKKDNEYILRCDNTSLTLYTWTSSGLNSFSTTLVAGTLYHVCATWDGTTAILYVNGVQKNTSTPGGTTSTSANNWTIGAQSGGGEGWDGLIADVRLYNRALSAAEVWQLYAPQTRWQLYQPARAAVYVAPAPPTTLAGPLGGRAWMPKPAGSTLQVWLFSPQGYRQQLVSDYVGLSYGNGIRGGGRFSLELPPNFDTRYVKPLGYAVVEECAPGAPPRLEEVYVIQGIGGAQAAGGTRFLTLEGPTATDYFVGEHSRVVAALESQPGATYTDQADDILKKLVKDALGAGAGSSGTAEGRDLSVYAGFTVEGERGMGPSLTQDAFFRELDKVLAEVVKRSEEAESGALRLFFYCRPVSFCPLRFQFVVLPRLFGKYRGFKASAPVILAPEMGTISTVEMEYDLSEGWNSVYVAYQAKGLATRITDTRRRNLAPHGFREALFEATTGLGTAAGAASEAQATLNAGKERRLQRFKVANSRAVRWGDYGLGDVVGALAGGTRAEVEIAGYKVDHGPDGVKREIRVDAWEG